MDEKIKILVQAEVNKALQDLGKVDKQISGIQKTSGAFSGSMRKFGEQVSSFSPKIGGLFDKIGGSGLAGNIDKIAGSFGGLGTSSLAAAGGVAAVGAALVLAAKQLAEWGNQANEFQRQVANINTLIPGQTARTLELKASIMQLSEQYGKSAGDMTKATYDIISSMGDSARTTTILETATKASIAGLSSTAEAVSFLTSVTKGYGQETDEAIKKVSDLGFQTVKIGVTTFPELAASMGHAVPIARALGVSMEELFAVQATLTGVTGTTAETITQTRAAMTALMDPSKDLAALYKELGVANGEAAVKQFGFVGMLERIKQKSDETNIPLGQFLGRVEAQTAVLALAGAQANKYTAALDAMRQAAGSTDEALAEQTLGLGRWATATDKIKASWDNFILGIGSAVGPILGGLAEALQLIVSGFGQLFLTIGTVVDVGTRLISWVVKLNAFVWAGVAIWNLMKLALIGVQWVFNKILELIIWLDKQIAKFVDGAFGKLLSQVKSWMDAAKAQLGMIEAQADAYQKLSDAILLARKRQIEYGLQAGKNIPALVETLRKELAAVNAELERRTPARAVTSLPGGSAQTISGVLSQGRKVTIRDITFNQFDGQLKALTSTLKKVNAETLLFGRRLSGAVVGAVERGATAGISGTDVGAIISGAKEGGLVGAFAAAIERFVEVLAKAVSGMEGMEAVFNPITMLAENLSKAFTPLLYGSQVLGRLIMDVVNLLIPFIAPLLELLSAVVSAVGNFVRVIMPFLNIFATLLDLFTGARFVMWTVTKFLEFFSDGLARAAQMVAIWYNQFAAWVNEWFGWTGLNLQMLDESINLMSDYNFAIQTSTDLIDKENELRNKKLSDLDRAFDQEVYLLQDLLERNLINQVQYRAGVSRLNAQRVSFENIVAAGGTAGQFQAGVTVNINVTAPVYGVTDLYKKLQAAGKNLFAGVTSSQEANEIWGKYMRGELAGVM